MTYTYCIGFKIIDRSPSYWFNKHNREKLETLLTDTLPDIFFIHIGEIYMFTDADEVTTMRKIAHISSCIGRAFLSRVHVHHYMHNLDDEEMHWLKEVVDYHAYVYFGNYTVQEDLFKPTTLLDMPDWFLKGTWITPSSM